MTYISTKLDNMFDRYDHRSSGRKPFIIRKMLHVLESLSSRMILCGSEQLETISIILLERHQDNLPVFENIIAGRRHLIIRKDKIIIFYKINFNKSDLRVRILTRSRQRNNLSSV